MTARVPSSKQSIDSIVIEIAKALARKRAQEDHVREQQKQSGDQ
jgi:hypothetical protein